MRTTLRDTPPLRDTPVPRTRGLDSTLALVRDGYDFISDRCRRYGSEVFETRLLFERTLCLVGAEAAKVFYDPDRFERAGAAPARLPKTLFGQGGVQGLDDAAHRSRKRMFMSIMTPESIRDLVDIFEQEWQAALDRWKRVQSIVLYEEVSWVLCRAVCRWAGVPLAAYDVRRRTADLQALIAAPAAVGPAYWRGRRARRDCERWLAEIVRQVRRGELTAPVGGVLHTFAEHREPDGHTFAEHREPDRQLLPDRVAAVELLNILRPVVAVDRFITFAALALHLHPRCREQLSDGSDPEVARRFTQEVRRFYPFFPAVVARVRTDFDWNGVRFPQGRRVLLGLYGTDHDPRLWSDPDQFRPERFVDRPEDPWTLIPQGGGDHHVNHRCPGEWITIELIQSAVTLLASGMSYDVPDQDLRVSLRQMPTLPNSRLVLANVSQR
ncbi:fatty-acid peroxygenase [Micromonospora polyrhachis]|uniref:Fatty-acid peroxygenase n=1 Tax=Micromonospora polyrhachis TaxID=1282883 RepID=A0A7W7SV63_9ACTN|nr:cytochrome P450 [Micromonospora polyrhachis]MBB4961506.1 fatty-acid peroxygenase [Micromonospora polyrhachis]